MNNKDNSVVSQNYRFMFGVKRTSDVTKDYKENPNNADHDNNGLKQKESSHRFTPNINPAQLQHAH